MNASVFLIRSLLCLILFLLFCELHSIRPKRPYLDFRTANTSPPPMLTLNLTTLTYFITVFQIFD